MKDGCGRVRRIPLTSPAQVGALVVVDADGNDVAYLEAVMEQERDGTPITITEEMIVKNDTVVRRQKTVQTPDGDKILRAERHR